MLTNVLALLPELILTLTGVLVMLAEPCLAPASSRKPLGWIAIAGTVGALFASWYQVSLGTLHAFSNTIQVDAFSILFHYVIGAVVLVTLLVSLDYFEGNASHAGEYFALLCFGAVGMMLMTAVIVAGLGFVKFKQIQTAVGQALPNLQSLTGGSLSPEYASSFGALQSGLGNDPGDHAHPFPRGSRWLCRQWRAHG